MMESKSYVTVSIVQMKSWVEKAGDGFRGRNEEGGLCTLLGRKILQSTWKCKDSHETSAIYLPDLRSLSQSPFADTPAFQPF